MGQQLGFLVTLGLLSQKSLSLFIHRRDFMNLDNFSSVLMHKLCRQCKNCGHGSSFRIFFSEDFEALSTLAVMSSTLALPIDFNVKL